ncbi:Tcc1i14-2.7 [Diplonema papillatum]|nr:Tcc1i14-2.7 [Diplonema papillatum]
MVLEGVLEKRGNFRRWAPICLRLDGTKLSVLDLTDAGRPDAKAKDVLVVQHVEQGGEEYTMMLHFTGGVSKRGLLGGTKDTKWNLRAKSAEQYDRWLSATTDAVRQSRLSQGQDSTEYDYGLPPTDPRTDLPLAKVPQQLQPAFGHLKTAVLHWFGPVKCLTADFGNEDNICFLGDKNVYLSSESGEPKRCFKAEDIVKLLVAQDSKKDLYVIIVMPETVKRDGADTPEYDLMFHSSDIKSFVRFLRTVYIHQTQKMLPLEQLRDKDQLENEIRLAPPPGYETRYVEPMHKETLVQILDMWYKSSKMEENEKFKEQVAKMLASSDVMGGPAPGDAAAAAAAAAPAAAAPAATPAAASRELTAEEKHTDLPKGAEKDPLGRLLRAIGLTQYYDTLSQNKLTVDLLQSGLIDDNDLRHFGVADAKHRQILLETDSETLNEAKKKPAQAEGDDSLSDISLPDMGLKKLKGVDDSFELSTADFNLAAVMAPKSVTPDVMESDEGKARSVIVTDEHRTRADLYAAASAFAPVQVRCDVSTPLGKFLRTLKLPQYYGYLTDKGVTLETLACGLVDDSSLELFGIDDPNHRVIILKGLEDPELVGDEALGWITTTEEPTKPLIRLEEGDRADLVSSEAAARSQLVAAFTEQMPAPGGVDESDPLGRFLSAISLPKYYWSLAARNMGLEVMTSGLVDDDDLKNHCDIRSVADRKLILAALADPDLVKRAAAGPVPANSWSAAHAAKNTIMASQDKIKVRPPHPPLHFRRCC